ncbi:uncharacterized protein DUF1702 [Nocardiopsis sp. Huas11]|nr:uncharacterized protein DUF1702 [Nocardiopsis sp. Huas11]
MYISLPMSGIGRALLGFSADETAFDTRGFHRGDPSAVRDLERAGAAFHAGYTAALQDLAAAPETFRVQDGPSAGFAYEGAGMALCLADALSLPHGTGFSRFVAGPARRSRYTAQVGAGWALARLPRPLWRPVLRQLDPLLGWLAWDGHGFHQEFFAPGRPHRSPLPGYVGHAVAQGIGRALWFSSCAEPELVARAVARYAPRYHADLWSGAGLAAVFTGAPHTDVLRSSAHGHGPALAQGAAFAAKALIELGPVTERSRRAVADLAGTGVEEAAAVTDEVLAALDRAPDAPDAPHAAPPSGLPVYEAWRRGIAARLSSGAPSVL